MKIPSPEEDFDYFVRRPWPWVLKAQTLNLAANELFKQFIDAYKNLNQLDGVPLEIAIPIHSKVEFFQPAGMLAGLSLEVLIKANIVALYPDRLKIGMKVNDWSGGKRLNGHDLLALSKEANLEINNIDMLSTLSKFSIWKGRYPSSMNGTTMYGLQAEIENFSGSHWVDLVKSYQLEYQLIREQVLQNIET